MRHRDFIYYSAHQLGAKLIFIDNTFPDWVKPFAHDMLFCNEPANGSEVIAVLEQYIKQQSIQSGQSFHLDGIVSFDDYSVVSAASASQHFGLPTTPSSVVARVKNKYRFRQECALAGVYTPKTLLLDIHRLANGEYATQLQHFPFPCVLKPIAGAGSHFVRRIESLPMLLDVLRQYDVEARATGEVMYWKTDVSSPQPTEDASKHGTDQDGSDADDDAPESVFMIEELLLGEEVDIDMVVQHGVIKFIAIADNFPTKGPDGLFMESGGAQPSQLSEEVQASLLETARAMVLHFGNQLSGVFHFEAMWTSHGAVPIELNLRLGGSEVLAFVLAVYRVNLGLEALKIACGIDCQELNTTPLLHCVSTNILACDSGYVRKVGFQAELYDDPRFVGGMHRCWVGQPLKAPPLGFQFLAWLVASGPTTQDAQVAIGQLQHHFSCHISPYPLDDPEGLVPGTELHYLKAPHPGTYNRLDCSLVVQQGDCIQSIISHQGTQTYTRVGDPRHKTLNPPDFTEPTASQMMEIDSTSVASQSA